MKGLAVHRGADQGDLVGRVLCHDIRGRRNEVVLRKGHALRAEDIATLNDASWSEIHLVELGPDDIGQREAGERLAASVSSDGLLSAPSGHRHVLEATRNGLVKIDTTALLQLNSIAGIAVYTLRNDEIAAKDQMVADTQITTLAIDRRSIEAAERIAHESGSVIRLLPFVPREAIVWMRDDRHLRAVTGKLHWFGCPVREVIELQRDSPAIRESMEEGARSGASLFIVSGSNALDPLDPVFSALESLGAKMQRIGMPVHPGTMLWISTWRKITIIGLPTCSLGTMMTAFDLVLPKLLAEGRIGDEELAALGHGGILASGAARAGLRRRP